MRIHFERLKRFAPPEIRPHTHGGFALKPSLLTTAFLCLPIANGQESEPQPSTLESVRADAVRLQGMVSSELALKFLAASEALPVIEGQRVVYWNRSTRKAHSAAQAEQVPAAELEGFRRLELDESFYYHTLYGTPMAYSRVLDLVAEQGFETAQERRILDFGYGNAAHLRLLASLGAHAVGVDVDELLGAYYCEAGDTGAIARAKVAGAGEPGSLRLVTGQFPATEAIVKQVGGNFDLVLSKNVLKLGYIHPEREPEPAAHIDLGVDDAAFLAAVHGSLKPGGLFAIYNIYPAQVAPEDGYLAWATGDCPWPRELVERADFEVLAFNVNDDRQVREMGQRLGWDGPPQNMDLENSLFATYTILRRKKR